ncbi:cytochrome c [Azospirillum sp. TSO22-1]|uniref:c-type cytochrome n=1 Tax=Azospirillum sp. TSO22-1 TaxID=716789 RepID=UPI000D64B21D|nr:cytochrome c [Azospirillum sp. TSO22-1]
MDARRHPGPERRRAGSGSGPGPGHQRRRKKKAVAAPEIENGRKVYNFRCYFCHGYSGDARTVAAQQLDPPPRNFVQSPGLTLEKILSTLEHGSPGTGMKSFRNVLSAYERRDVAVFVLEEFVRRGNHNTAYHTPENGWPDHAAKYGAAYPFVQGKASLDTPPATLDDKARAGRALFVEACITCHEPRNTANPTIEAFPLSHMGTVVRGKEQVDAISRASTYASHDVPPVIAGLTEQETKGKAIFDQNCAFCHAADGTAKNWIGAFLQPHPRNFTDITQIAELDRARLEKAVRQGLPNTSMPAWGAVLSDAEIKAVISYVERAFLTPTRAAAKAEAERLDKEGMRKMPRP